MLGYCCNVHPGRSLTEVRRSLTDYSLAVKRRCSADSPLGVGLWLSATTSRELLDTDVRNEFRDWLNSVGLVPYTLNGFPYGDFHDTVVKHRVYLPTWADESRLRYTLDLAEVLQDLLPTGSHGTISTLPLGWPTDSRLSVAGDFELACASNLVHLARSLADLRERSGRKIVVCVEPEPGCWLDSSEDVVRFFEDRLGDSAEVRTHLAVCHDICHSGVMFEEQSVAIQAYRDARISIGKVQVSSAVSLDFDRLSAAESETALSQLEAFAEPRYLHQTCWKVGDQIDFFEDLPEAIATVRKLVTQNAKGVLRVHFHVPIFTKNLGLLSTTQADIQSCLAAISAQSSDSVAAATTSPPVTLADVGEIHFEVETYAWNVLPFQWRPESLSAGIAQELIWLQENSRLN